MQSSVISQLSELADTARWLEVFAAAHIDATTRGPLELKMAHTRRVLGHAREIADSLVLSPEQRRSALLAALLHDVGRFPQFKQWRTFRDADSTNHGHLGARILREHDVLGNEAVIVRSMVLLGVALHNRYALPGGLPESPRLITSVVRDADKIDILYIFSQELQKPQPSPDVVLHVAREPEKWSLDIAEMILQGQVPDYKQLRFVNDFIMLLGSWLPSLVFETSLEIVRKSGTIENLMQLLPCDPMVDAVKLKVYGSLYI